MSQEPTPPSQATPPPLPRDPKAGRRWGWRVGFWLFFIATPVAGLQIYDYYSRLRDFRPSASVDEALRADGMAPYAALAAVAIGSLAAGLCVTRLHLKPKSALGAVGMTLVIGLGLVHVYAALAFVGCLVILSKSNF